MKQKTFTLTLFLSFLMAGILNAQFCGSSGPSECTPFGNLSQPGLEPSDSLSCVEQGLDFDEALELKMFTTFFAAGGSYVVDSIEFTKIDSLPCGLCWSTSKSNNRFAANETGCIRIQGTTNDNVGQYKTYITLKAWLNNGSQYFPVVPPPQVDAAGIKLIVRVKSPSGACAAADTSSSANNLSTSPSLCSTSTQDLFNDISEVQLTPNPVSSQAVLTFNCAKNESYTLRIADVTGKVKNERSIQTCPGMNTVVIQRNELSSGIYFLSIGNGPRLVTKKFTVID